MPVARINDIDVNYKLEGDGAETIVLINGLAGDLETWVFQAGDFLAAGYRVLRFDNRGIGASSKPAGPYSSRMLADDAKALVDSLGITDFHLMGVSMGGMIAQEYALAYGPDLRSATFACTYAAPGPFCSRMFDMWAGMAPVLGIPYVMRDVTLWAFTVPFFEQRGEELAEFETAMRYMDQPVHAYLAQLAVIQQHDTTSRLSQIAVPTLVLAGEQDILIPVSLSRRLHEQIHGAQWATTRGGHACLWEYPLHRVHRPGHGLGVPRHVRHPRADHHVPGRERRAGRGVGEVPPPRHPQERLAVGRHPGDRRHRAGHPVWGDLRPGQPSPFNALPWLTVGLIAVGVIYALVLAAVRPQVLERAPALLEGDESLATDPLLTGG